MWFCDNMWLVIWVPNSGMAGTIHAVSWHHKLLEVPARKLQQESAPGWLDLMWKVWSQIPVFPKPLCWALGNESLLVLRAWPKDYTVTLHPFLWLPVRSHGQPRRTNGVQFNYAVFLAQYGQLGWIARAGMRAQRLRIKWCAETVDVFGRRRSFSNLILCGLSLGSVKQSEWSVQNEFIQQTQNVSRYPLETLKLKNSWKSWILLVTLVSVIEMIYLRIPVLGRTSEGTLWHGNWPRAFTEAAWRDWHQPRWVRTLWGKPLGSELGACISALFILFVNYRIRVIPCWAGLYMQMCSGSLGWIHC